MAFQLIHGILGVLILVSGTMVLSLLSNLDKKSINYYKILIIIFVISVLLTNILGWLIYPAYRTQTKETILKENPLAGELFETKEHIAWFTFPLALVILLTAFTKDLLTDKHIRTTSKVLISLILLMSIIVVALGYYISSVKSLGI